MSSEPIIFLEEVLVKNVTGKDYDYNDVELILTNQCSLFYAFPFTFLDGVSLVCLFL